MCKSDWILLGKIFLGATLILGGYVGCWYLVIYVIAP